MTDSPPPGSPCNQCGKCCTNPNYMGTLFADGADVIRWRKEGRDDILRYAYVPGDEPDASADLWIDSWNGGKELYRCPFVRKNPNSPKHRCTIYETRPQVCRDYEPWTPHSICEVLKA
jgi:Fe-S-cluster containining protein